MILRKNSEGKNHEAITKVLYPEHVKIRKWLDRGRENKGLW
ncbi:hypothetical protein [Hydrogenivirga sp. 128-5-R1-1]|nr:hypothetical protein [Hydrogenivirga sp. 128-5-R1-1]